MRIQPVKSARDQKDFILFPYQFYKDDPNWVPPLRGELRNQFKPEKNPFLKHCEWQLFLLKDHNKIIGRIAAFIDTIAIDFWQERIGLFGYFDCINDQKAAHLLLDAAHGWLKTQDCSSMRGPWSFVSQEWGMVVEGFSPPPVIMAPYNPPYYNDLLSVFGFNKVKDLICWEISFADGYQIPKRILAVTDALAERYGIKIRQLNIKNYQSEIETLIELSNDSLIENWGYSPVTDEEVNAMAHDMKRIIQPKGVLFAEDATGKPIGFAIALPDLNVLNKNLNGKLFPFGFIKVLRGIPQLRKYRMFALGVIPKYQGKAVDSLLYRALNESLAAKDLWIEINYVLEDNWPMINAITKLGAKQSRR